MSYVLYKDHTKVNYTKGNTGRKYIVIHYTGNSTDSAKGNANYFRDVNRGASAHYFVDASSVYEVVDPANTAWAVGVKYGAAPYWGKCTNGNSISIEMCSTGGKISDATFANVVAFTKSLMSKYNIPAANVIRHYDVCLKRCPGWSGWLPNNETIWNSFKKQIGTAPAPAPAPAPTPDVIFTYAVRAGGKILPAVTNLNDYAGIIGTPITDIAIKVNKGSLQYRVHVKGGKWLPFVSGYNWKDGANGYAGNGKQIDAVQVILTGVSGKVATYRVSPVKKNYYPWQKNSQTTGGQDGYAGAYGVAIDRLQIY